MSVLDQMFNESVDMRERMVRIRRTHSNEMGKNRRLFVSMRVYACMRVRVK